MNDSRKKTLAPSEEILRQFLNKLQRGNYSSRLDPSQNHNLSPFLVESLNQLAQALEKNFAELAHRENQWQEIYQSSPLGIIELDDHFCIVRSNAAYQGMLEYTEEELRGKSMVEITHPEDKQSSRLRSESITHPAGHVERFEKRYLSRTGKTVWVRVTSRVLQAASGGSRFISVIEDITEVKRSQAESETILQTLSEGLVIQGQRGDIEKFNPEALTILGLSEDQLLGRTSLDPRWQSIKENGTPYPGKEHPAMVALQTNKPVKNAIMGLTLPSGEERWIKINAIPFEGSNERKVAVTFGDITQIVQANRDIHHIFHHSADLLCISSIDATFRRISPGFGKVLGWSEAELLDRPCIDFIHPDDVEATKLELQKLAQGMPMINFENRYRTSSGDYRLINWACEPDTKTGFIYGTGRDFTNYRRIERRNHDILKAIDQSAIVSFADAKGKITEANDNFCKISGYAREELIGQDHRIVNSGVHPKSFFENLWQTITAGHSWTGEIRNRSKVGEHYTVKTFISPLRSLDGKIEQYMSIRFDMTDQKRLQTDLLEAQQIAKIGSWRYDLSTGHLAWSSEHYRIFEIDEPQPPEVLFKLYQGRIHPEDRALLQTTLERAMKYGEDVVYNHRVYLDAGARVKYVRGIGRITKDNNGRAIAFSGTCQDLTDFVALQEQKLKAIESLELERAKSMHNAKLASLGEMSAGIAHEINNPLAIISGNLPLLLKFKNDDTKFLAKVDSITKSVERIEKIVKGLKKFSRSSIGNDFKVEMLESIIYEALIITEAKAKRHSTLVSTEVEPNLYINCDLVEIEQVLVNLINNGIDAVKDKMPRWVQIRAFNDGQTVVVQVLDSGPGIAPEIEAKLFQPFFTTKMVGEGTGLGLSIAKGILDSHKSSLTLNHSFKNTCFEIRIPKSTAPAKKKVA